MGQNGQTVWYAIPCANYDKAAQTLPVWKEQGYKIALLTDQGKPVPLNVSRYADITVAPWAEFKGYPAAVNFLVNHMIPATVPVIVTGGDDMYPDRHHTAPQILEIFRGHFPDLFGVMQPTGDDLDGTDRICGSPWMGRRFMDEVNGGQGPYWHEYFAFYSDEELFNVTRLLGCLWQNPHLTHHHDHWSRRGGQAPPHIALAQSKWDQDKALFTVRKMAGFPGHERLGRVRMCRGCGQPLLKVNETVADGCPCNTPRGINHGLVRTEVCTCAECDPAQTGSSRVPYTPQ